MFEAPPWFTWWLSHLPGALEVMVPADEPRASPLALPMEVLYGPGVGREVLRPLMELVTLVDVSRILSYTLGGLL